MYVSPHYIYTPFSAIDYPRLGDIRAPSWATGLERGETIISEFRGTGFAGSAVRGGCRTRRGTVVSREWWFLFFFFNIILLFTRVGDGGNGTNGEEEWKGRKNIEVGV